MENLKNTDLKGIAKIKYIGKIQVTIFETSSYRLAEKKREVSGKRMLDHK